MNIWVIYLDAKNNRKTKSFANVVAANSWIKAHPYLEIVDITVSIKEAVEGLNNAESIRKAA